ncbi:hypothetical protein CHS0354_013445 [Potamilus streckersoni]|uniref:Uncharacterized protein n=1 Tax=Potamilus streckersoni TaxID=2493646 RepID=A0AAE0RYI2_9BIVA|nr:hypothetical protein CHS0354_013445 [Potamilus streckersoni]
MFHPNEEHDSFTHLSLHVLSALPHPPEKKLTARVTGNVSKFNEVNMIPYTSCEHFDTGITNCFSTFVLCRLWGLPSVNMCLVVPDFTAKGRNFGTGQCLVVPDFTAKGRNFGTGQCRTLANVKPIKPINFVLKKFQLTPEVHCTDAVRTEDNDNIIERLTTYCIVRQEHK